MFRMRRISWFALILIFASASAIRAQQFHLTNMSTQADFDARGLRSLEDTASGVRIEFARDEWSIAVGDRTLQSLEAKPEVSQPEPDRVTYEYRWPGYHVQVRYNIAPQWQFVSKQIAVLEAPAAVFTVHAVTALDMESSTPIAAGYTPSIYAPQFGATIEETRKFLPGRDLGIFLRMGAGSGAMFLVQNPYLTITRKGGALTAAYTPEMEWNLAWGPFAVDTACIGVYPLTGRRLPREMVKEWHLPPAAMPDDGMDRAEIEAYSNCVRAYLLHPSAAPISIEAAWTLNDYQIDVGTAEGRAEYKRVIDTVSALGVQTVLYAPANSQLSDREKSADSWKWDYVLWLGLGEKIRKGEWVPGRDPLPASVKEMLDYARSRHVGLLAYVYPSIPFDANPAWIVRGQGGLSGHDPQFTYSTLASRAFQDYLIEKLIAFKRQAGIAGYSFDYTWLTLPGSSSYAQWHGWRRVMEALRQAEPDIVIDGRQSYQLFGPWSWLAGSYPHPTGTDEQAESFTPFPDLHFDRVSADRMRFADYWYRNYQFAPAQVVPGYATHQTERSRNMVGSNGKVEEEMLTGRFRPRDWDYLGFRYSFLSSIAVGGWNNVVDMIPARDLEEDRDFSPQDKAWIRNWLDWTARNGQYLLHTRTILDQPALGHVDGTSAIAGDRGFLFLFNPNYKRMSAAFSLDNSIGLKGSGEYLLREVYPREDRLIGKPGAGLWKAGDRVEIELDGTSATVLELSPAAASGSPLVFNASPEPGKPHPRAVLRGDTLAVEHAANEPGTVHEAGVLLPTDARVARMTFNGQAAFFHQTGRYVATRVSYDGERFAQAQEVPLSAGANDELSGEFTVPRRILDQLEERHRAWPIPWAEEDYETTWLVPERLLLFLQVAEPRDTMSVQATLDGKPLVFKPAYSSVRVHAESFVGFYADLSAIAPDERHIIVLRTAGIPKQQLQGLFFDNVTPQWTETTAP